MEKIKIIVCIKQVPDTNKVKVNPESGTLIREGVPSIMNPDDKHALIEAIKMRDKHNGKVTAISMGPPQAEEVLREALAFGADDAVLLCDRAFAGSDTWATANALGSAIRFLGDYIGGYSLLLFGMQAVDGSTAQVGPQTAELLNIPQITYVRKIDIKIDVRGNKVRAEREMEDGYEVVESKMPCLLACLSSLNKVKYPPLNGIREAYRNKKVRILNAEEVKADKSRIGLLSSPTSVRKSFPPQAKGGGLILKGSAKETARKMVLLLKEKGLTED